MNKVLVILFTCLVSLPIQAQNRDLPGPSGNLQTIPSGSYIIPMDNTLQVNSSGLFNLKAYGLIVHLLNNKVKIRWAIRAGKLKDGIDFSAMAEQIKPAPIAGASLRNFKAGPFIIFASDTSGVAALVDAYYTAFSLTGANRPSVYRLSSGATNVDIRYNLSGFRPKAAILTDGGKASFHIAYMTAAGIPAMSYATSAGNNLIEECFTFASEPHNSASGPVVDATITAIRNFVSNGGNFLAQCEAVNNYENNPLGRFQTTGGIVITNSAVNTTCEHVNADLSYSQFDGPFDMSYEGSVTNWQIVGSAANNEHNHITGTGSLSSSIGASVSKMTNHIYGSLVFYLGSHTFSPSGVTGTNGIRMYMNAFLTPSYSNCSSRSNEWVLASELVSFSASKENNATVFNWTISTNEKIREFVIEKSRNGIDFIHAGKVTASAITGRRSYEFIDAGQEVFSHFRLKIVNQNNDAEYSQIIILRSDVNHQKPLQIITNPFTDRIYMNYFSASVETVTIKLLDQTGAVMYSEEKPCVQGMNGLSIKTDRLAGRSYYLVQVNAQNGSYSQLVLKL
jgi:hypothetical protein